MGVRRARVARVSVAVRARLGGVSRATLHWRDDTTGNRAPPSPSPSSPLPLALLCARSVSRPAATTQAVRKSEAPRAPMFAFDIVSSGELSADVGGGLGGSASDAAENQKARVTIDGWRGA